MEDALMRDQHRSPRPDPEERARRGDEIERETTTHRLRAEQQRRARETARRRLTHDRTVSFD
jgi:hypothetical protein